MLKDRKVWLIFGKTGGGKSWLAKKIIERYKRVIVFDPREEYSGYVVQDFADFIDYIKNRDTFTVVCRYRDPEDFDYTAKACEILQEVLLVLEECEVFISSYDTDVTLPVNALISFGRHSAVSILAISRRPTEVSVKLRAQTDGVITFKQTEPAIIKYLEQWGFSPEEIEALDASKYEYALEGKDPFELPEKHQASGDIL